MGGFWGIAIIIGIIVLAIVVAVYSSLQERKRVQGLENTAQTLGLNFFATDPFSISLTYNIHALFQEGDEDRYAYDVLEGDYSGRHLQCFDYHYVTISRDSKGNRTRTAHYFSCALFDINLPLKYLFIRHENFLDRIESAIGIHSITFESAEFNRKFNVKSEDKKFAYDIIHPRMMEFFLQAPFPYSVELRGHSILLYKHGKLQPNEVISILDAMSGFVKLFPGYLLEQMKAG